MRFPFQGEPTSLKDWWNCSWKQHWPAIWGALYWAVGTLGYSLAAPHLGYAVTYVFGQSTPFVTSLYSIFYFKEFANASKKTWFWEIVMLLSFAASLGFMCLAHEWIVCFWHLDYQLFVRITLHYYFKMKTSFVLKLLIFAYIPLSVYYSSHNQFAETTMDVDVWTYFPISVRRSLLVWVRRSVSITVPCLRTCGMIDIFISIPIMGIILCIRRILLGFRFWKISIFPIWLCNSLSSA